MTEPTDSALTASDRATASTAAGQLVRTLGPAISIAVVVGNVIGSGIFLKPGNIAAECGRFDVILSVWVAGGVLCVLGAICLAELGTTFPHAGGPYVYLREAYGRPTAFLYGWNEFCFARPGSIGALAVAFVGSLTTALRWQPDLLVQVALSAVLVGGLAGVNVVGALWGGRLQLLVTVVKAGFLALVALSPLLFMPFVGSTIEAANYGSTVAPRQPDLALQIGVALLAVMWAYNGWHGITPLAEEIRDPQRNVPLALFAGVGILIVLYLSANLAYHGVLSMAEMSAAGDHAAERMLQTLAGPAGLTAMSLVILCSTFGAINTNLLEAPRITFAMGRDGTFFRTLGQVHAVHRTPVASILANAVLAVALIAAAALGKRLVRDEPLSGYDWELTRRIVQSLQDDSIFDLLTNFVIFGSSIFYALAVFAVVVLRIRAPHRARPYRAWGYPLTPLLFCGVYVWFLMQVYAGKPLESRVGLALIALGLPVYFAFQRWGRRQSHGP